MIIACNERGRGRLVISASVRGNNESGRGDRETSQQPASETRLCHSCRLHALAVWPFPAYRFSS